jgi:hypothetical protein
MQQPQQVQTHHQVVEEIMPDQMSDEVTKEVINQFLPQRKRKPRQPKGPKQQHKIIKLEPQASGSDQQNIVTSLPNVGSVEPGSDMIVEEHEQDQMGGELVEQVVTTGEEGEVKMEIKMEDGSAPSGTGVTPKTPKTPKDKSSSEFSN